MTQQQITQESIFSNLLNEANGKFTPYFFGNFEKSPENVISEKNSRLLRILDSASDLKKKFLEFLEKNQPKGQEANLKTQHEINEQYKKFTEDIEKRNEFLKTVDAETKKTMEDLERQIHENKIDQSLLQDELETLKETPTRPLTKPGAKVDTYDPGVILHTNKDVAKMKILVPDSKPK
jgi:hypothetical protein